MNEPNFIFLLRLVKSRAGFSSLRERGLEYSQLFEMISRGVNLGYIASSETGLTLTIKGLAFLQTEVLEHEGQLRTDGNWIEPADSSRIEKIGIDEPYVPCKKEINFD